jgi:hypothetical protein
MLRSHYKSGALILAGLICCALLMRGDAARAQNDNSDGSWSEWVNLSDGYLNLITYRTATRPDSLNFSGYRTQYEVYNQYAFSVTFILKVTYIEDGESFDEERRWHLGPNSSGSSAVDTPSIDSAIIRSTQFHMNDPIPQ